MFLKTLTIRNEDSGDGHFGTRRSGGHTHEGVDYVVTPGQAVTAPENGVLTRIAYPYGGDTNNKGFVFIGNSGIEYKVFYAAPITSKIGNTVKKGQTIATAQNISLKYPELDMTPHIHIEMRKNGVLLDPEKHLKSNIFTLENIAIGAAFLLVVAIAFFSFKIYLK